MLYLYTITHKMLSYFYFGDFNINCQITKFTDYGKNSYNNVLHQLDRVARFGD